MIAWSILRFEAHVPDCPTEQTFTNALTRARLGAIAVEARGLVRWLRPEFQAPEYATQVTGTFDLGEATPVLLDNVYTWPGSLPEQFIAVQRVLVTACCSPRSRRKSPDSLGPHARGHTNWRGGVGYGDA